jgi:peptidoglycan/LPS O-acetylase OafA/YrhL
VALLVAILCAAVSYRFVEQPFLRLKARFTKPSVTRDAAHAVTTAR